MEIVVGFFWLVFSFVVAGLASSRGRSGLSWWVVSLLISPLLAGFLIFLFPDLKAARDKQAAEARKKASGVEEAQKRQAEQAEAARQITGLAVAEELQKIANLKKMNIINEGELESQKTVLFQKLTGRFTTNSLGDFFMPIGKLVEGGEINQGDLEKLKAIYSRIAREQ